MKPALQPRKAAEALWSLFVQYPNKEPVCRELPAPRSLLELRDTLQVFDDQHLLVASRNGSAGPGSGAAEAKGYSLLEQVEQLYDGAVLCVTVPRRRIFVGLVGSNRTKSVAWYPGASAEQIESAVVKACGLPLGTPIELLNGEDAVVISATIPNDSVLAVMPLVDSVNGPDLPRELSMESPAGFQQGREGRSSVVRSGGRGNNSARGGYPGRARSATPSSGSHHHHHGYGTATSSNTSASAHGATTPGRSGSAPGAGSRGSSPLRAPSAVDLAASPTGRVSAPDEHCVHILAGHAGFVLSLCSVGDVLFTGSQDCSIMIWDLNNLQYIGTLPGHRGFVKCMVATLSKKVLCSGSQDRTIKVWSLETFSSTKTLLGHTGDVNALALLEHIDALVSASEDRSVRVWDLTQFELLMSLDQAHLSGVFAIRQIDNNHFISTSRDRSIKLWLSTTWQCRKTLAPPHYDGVSDVAVGTRSGRFYSASRDRSIRRWDVRTFESDLQLTHAHGDWLTSMALAPSEETLYSGSKDCVVKVWDTDLHCRDLLLGHRGSISALLTVENHLFSASHDRTVRVWRVDHYESRR